MFVLRNGRRHKRKSPALAGLFLFNDPGSWGLNIGRLLTLRALSDLELYLLSFFQCLESVHLNGGEMREQVFATIVRSDETKTL